MNTKKTELTFPPEEVTSEEVYLGRKVLLKVMGFAGLGLGPLRSLCSSESSDSQEMGGIRANLQRPNAATDTHFILD